MEIEPVLNYLDDGIKRNNERLSDLEIYIKNHPSKSLQKKNIKGGIYYCLMFRKHGKVKQKYLGSKYKIDLKKEKQKLSEYNKKLMAVKKRYQDLKERNYKLKKIFDVAYKLYDE